MDEPVLTLDAKRLRVEPGHQAQLRATLAGRGHLVESFRLDVVGLDPSWWQVHPPELALYPGEEESAVVLLTPPANAQAPEDALPFGIRAVSTLDAQRSVVEEGDLEIGRVLDLQPSITPVTSRGRWSGRHTITYINWGNSPIHLRLTVSDSDEQLGFRLEPEQVSVPVGGSAKAALRVRPRKPFLRGAAVRRPFQVIGESARSAPAPGAPRSDAARVGIPDPGRPVLDGAIQHLPVLSAAVIVIAGLLALAVAGLVVAVLQTSSVVGARTADVAPEPPNGLVAEGIAADLIQLRWEPSDRAELYRVQRVDETSGAVLSSSEVEGGSTGLSAKVEQPLTRACYRVIAARGPLASEPGQTQCATSRDGRLPPPTNVQVTAIPAGYSVAWTDDDQNEHSVLANGAQVGAVSPAGARNLTVPLPAGRQCVTVVARRGEQLSSPESAPPQCVDSTGPPATASAAAPPPVGGGGGAVPTAGAVVPPAGGPSAGAAPPSSGAPATPPATVLTPWVDVIGPPFQEQALADTQLQEVRKAAPTAQVVPATAVPTLGFLPPTVVIVVSGFNTREDAAQWCERARTAFPQCAPTASAPG